MEKADVPGPVYHVLEGPISTEESTAQQEIGVWSVQLPPSPPAPYEESTTQQETEVWLAQL